MLSVALLGAGRIGRVHAKSIAAHAGSRLVAVADVHAPAAQELAKLAGAAVRDTESILADPTIDAVLIATSTDTHSDLIEAATAAGKAVLCEKPVDLDLARAKACLTKSQSSGQPVMVGFNRRFDPNFAALKTSYDAGEIGVAELLSITSFDPAPPPVEYIKVSGGIFRDMMIHDLDIAQWLMGARPVKVTAHGSALVDPAIGAAGDVDTAVATLHYADGRLCVIRNSRRAAYGYDQRIEILGSKGLLQADNVTESTITRAGSEGVISAKPVYFFLERYMRAYEIEWAQFVDAVQSGTPVPATLEEGVAALAVAEAATQSMKTGQTVDVPSV